MDTKKVLWGIVIFLLSLVVILDIDNIRNIFITPVDPLDAIYEYDDQEISVRKLFEASYEVLHYSNHWAATGSYSYKYDTYNYADGKLSSSPDESEQELINLRYDHFFVDLDNYLGILNGDCIDPYDSYSFYGEVDHESTVTTYNYYDGVIDGSALTAFGYSGHKISENFKVEIILNPDFDNIEDVSVVFDGSVDEQGHIVVTFIGNNLPCIATAFNEYATTSPYNEAIYTFDAKTKTLIEVTLKYESSSGGYGHDKHTRSGCINLTIEDITYGDCEIPEVPRMICDNSIISGAITGDETFKPSSFLNIDFSEENDFTSLIKCIWINTISSFTDECSLDDFSNKLSEIAALYDVEIKKDSYVLNKYEYSTYIKYHIIVDDNEVADIIMPLIVYGAKLKNDNNLLVDSNDELSVREDGSVWIKHEDPDSVSFEKCYMIYTDGTLTLDHMMTKVLHISNLLDDEEYDKFANFYDYNEIRAFAEEFEAADKTYLARYNSYEDGYNNAYYAVNDYYYSEDLSTRFGVQFIPQDEADQKNDAGRDEPETLWIMFD